MSYGNSWRVILMERPSVERLEGRMGGRVEGRGRLERERRGLEEEDYEDGDGMSDSASDDERKHGENEGEEGWRNSEGERLMDFGVDEDIEFYDEKEDDDVPLSVLLARRQAAQAAKADGGWTVSGSAYS